MHGPQGSVLRGKYCYTPVCKLPSISFSVNPVTSPSLSITYCSHCHTYRPYHPSSFTCHHLVSHYFILFFILDLFCSFYALSIIPWFCGWIIIVQHLCILVARQLAYCLCGLMICFLSNTLLFYLEYFLYHYLRSWIYKLEELLPYSRTSVLNQTRYLLKFNSTSFLSLSQINGLPDSVSEGMAHTLRPRPSWSHLLSSTVIMASVIYHYYINSSILFKFLTVA